MRDPTSFIQTIEPFFNGLAASVAAASVVLAITAFLKSARRLKIGDLEVGITTAEITREITKAAPNEKPFETTALANYYNQVLSRANVSFWFSLIFASIGFCVIIFAFMTHNPTDPTGTIIKVTSGFVIDAVSSLFFVQSTGAQKSMAEFFEKLRLDRLNAEAREMIGEIEDMERRDQLRAQLILKYSGIERLLVGSDVSTRE